MALNNIESKVQNLLEKVINDVGYELYDVIYEKEGKDFYLRIVIDSKNGISVDDCEIVNNAITDLLDEADYIKEQYFLEVSSPGVERNLRKEEHFVSQIGNKVVVKLFSPIEKQKELIGILKEYNNTNIVLMINENEVKVDLKNIAVARTVFDW